MRARFSASVSALTGPDAQRDLCRGSGFRMSREALNPGPTAWLSASASSLTGPHAQRKQAVQGIGIYVRSSMLRAVQAPPSFLPSHPSPRPRRLYYTQISF